MKNTDCVGISRAYSCIMGNVRGYPFRSVGQVIGFAHNNNPARAKYRERFQREILGAPDRNSFLWENCATAVRRGLDDVEPIVRRAFELRYFSEYDLDRTTIVELIDLIGKEIDRARSVVYEYLDEARARVRCHAEELELIPEAE